LENIFITACGIKSDNIVHLDYIGQVRFVICAGL
jgi:hypothetical protein